MKITYDEQVDAMYIQLLEGDFQCRTLRLSEVVALDIGPGEKLVGMEILDAKETLKLDEDRRIDLQNLKARLAS